MDSKTNKPTPETPDLQRVYLCGRGAVGLVYGDLFDQALSEENFAFLCDPKRAARYRAQPVSINGQPRIFRYLASDPENPKTDQPKADLILFACKSYSLDEAMEEAAPFIDEHTLLMSAINGISSESRLQERFPDNPVIHTIAQGMDACYDAAGQSETFTTRGELVFGAADPERAVWAEAVEELFLRCAIPYRHSREILLDQYRKLMLNCGINQVCAAYDATYGDVSSDPTLHSLFVQAMEEARTVMAALGQDPGQEALKAWDARIATLDPDSMPSMAQDMLAGRPVELDLFSGTIVPQAERLHLDVPVLKDLQQKIQARIASTD